MKRLMNLLRQNKRFFLLATLAALALRLFFVLRYPHVAGDTFIYGDIAKNWLNHGIYGVTDGLAVRPTLIRLPGYPAFLAALFSLFGQDHYFAVMMTQALIDVNTCLVIAALTLELMDARAARIAYLLAAACPFLANYVSSPLTETLAIAAAAHALYYGVRGIRALEAGESGLSFWTLSGLWCAAGILLRPDGGLVLVALGLPLLVMLFRAGSRRRAIVAGVVLAVASLTPLAPWAVRNWHVFQVFQPLAPRYADDPGEFVPHGFNHWMRTWVVDYVSVEEVYWPVPGEPVDLHLLPERAFDSDLEYAATEQLLADYTLQLDVDPALDARFEQLARQRVVHNPFRYFVWLPALRIADMWLRPRTEFLGVESRWWEFSSHPGESAFALLWAGLNLLYLVLAARGWLRLRLGLCGAALAALILLRSAFLGTLENPEPRYVLECFPVVIALAAGAFSGKARPTR